MGAALAELLKRPAACAAVGTAVFAAVVAWQIAHRGALSMDELHTALLGRAIAAGDGPSFYVGSVSRYEGGSWLIGYPVALLLRLGAWATAATSWTAGGLAIAAVFAASLWTARAAKPSAALGVGPILGLAAPEVVHYSYRAWGSLHEALFVVPVLALLGAQWLDRDRPFGGAVLLGLLLGAGLVLSYVHFVTGLAMAGVVALEAAGRAGPRAAARSTAADLGLAFLAAAAVLILWIAAAVPIPDEALQVRDGRTLTSTLPALLAVRLDLVLMDLPRAWIGAVEDVDGAAVVAAAGLSLLTVSAAVAVWRRGGRGRHAVVYALAWLPALSVGHSLAAGDDVLRYYVPLLATSAVLLSLWDPRAVAAACLLGLVAGGPAYTIPGQDPVRSHAELGANALHRYLPDPHAKLHLLHAHAQPALKAPLAFGYGLDTGRRFSATWSGLHEASGDVPAERVDPATDPHLHLYDASAWTAALDGAPEDVRAPFLEGLGVGLVADGVLDEAERRLIAILDAPAAAAVAAGIGAAGRAGQLPEELHEAARRGAARAASPHGLGRLIRLPIVPTPEG